MPMYHVNEAGEAGVCRAVKGECPFGSLDEHFTSLEAARASYEQSMHATPAFTAVKTAEGQTVYRFPVANALAATNAIAKANRRLEKLGVQERFTYKTKEIIVSVKQRYGVQTSKVFTELTLNTPAIEFEGYNFLALVEQAEAGTVVKTASNVDLNGYAPDDLRCESCGKAMKRQKTYLVEDKDGKIIQVGSGCVEKYFGVKPAGLWALTYDPLERAENGSTWHHGLGGEQAATTEDVLAIALYISNDGEDFISSSIARDRGGNSTADEVRKAIFGKETEETAAIFAGVEELKKTGAHKKFLQEIRELEGQGDYLRNLRTIAAGEWVKVNHFNIFVSALSQRAKQKRAEKKAAEEAAWGTPAPGYTAPVGASVAGKKLKVKKVSHRIQDDPYSYYGGEVETTQLVMRDEEGHEVVWWASKKIDTEEGQELTVKSGKVKAHKQYNGADQTVLTRVRLAE